MKLKPCECGRDVEVKYVAGISKSMRKYINNPFAGSVPRLYILCDGCGAGICIDVTDTTPEGRNKSRRKLEREWNR